MIEILFKDVPFLRGSYVDLNLCDKIIKFFDANENLASPGRSGGGVNEAHKKSTDMDISQTPYASEYFYELQKVLDMYIEEFPWSNNQSPFTVTEGCNLQRYKPGEGFYQWHCERDGVRDNVRDRHLVFMTYLNDVNDQGETEFYHQDIKIKPQKGLTVIWPADWTFVHRGISSPSETKYIATGWFNYIEPEDWNRIKENMNESRKDLGTN